MARSMNSIRMLYCAPSTASDPQLGACIQSVFGYASAERRFAKRHFANRHFAKRHFDESHFTCNCQMPNVISSKVSTPNVNHQMPFHQMSNHGMSLNQQMSARLTAQLVYYMYFICIRKICRLLPGGMKLN